MLADRKVEAENTPLETAGTDAPRAFNYVSSCFYSLGIWPEWKDELRIVITAIATTLRILAMKRDSFDCRFARRRLQAVCVRAEAPGKTRRGAVPLLQLTESSPKESGKLTTVR